MSEPLLDLIEVMGVQMNLQTMSNAELSKAIGRLINAVMILSEEQMRLVQAVNSLTMAYVTAHSPSQGIPN